MSPFGPLVASATAEGYQLHGARSEPAPYHGYYFRILTAQGAHAPGGARSYVKDGRMTGGFALIAWPADHGSSGVMTFLVRPAGRRLPEGSRRRHGAGGESDHGVRPRRVLGTDPLAQRPDIVALLSEHA